MTNVRLRTGFTLVETIVVIVIVGLLIALLLPAVQQAREAARRTQSKNHLKQIGLALHNYHDVFGMFPPGGIFNEEGTAFHGWTTSIIPYVDCAPLYNTLNFNIPWDDPQQIERFMIKISLFQNPSREPTVSPDKLPLVQYSANQWLFHRNSSTRIKDIHTGTVNTLAVAESYGHFTPFGYPYNWRDPLIPINSSPDAFGYCPLGMNALLFDGTVRWINKDMAAEIHASFAGPDKLKPTPRQVEKPAGQYRLGDRKIWTTVRLYSDRRTKWALEGRRNPENELIEARFVSLEKAPQSTDGPLDEALESIAGQVSLRRFDGGRLLSDAGLKTLAGFPKLESLRVGGEWITAAGLETIGTMSRLEDLQLWSPNVTDVGLRKLESLTQLTTLGISAKKLTSEGLSAIAGLKAVESLDLNAPDLRAGLFAELSRLPRLRQLEINDAKLSDEELLQAPVFPSLRTLELAWYWEEPEITPRAVVRFADRTPGVTISVRTPRQVCNLRSIRELAEEGMRFDRTRLFADAPADAEQPANGVE